MALTPTEAFIFEHSALAALSKPKTPPKPANQNGAPVVSEEVLVDALRHFAEFGLGAAAEALHRAETAFDQGEREAGVKWLEIGRALDRRLARQFQRELEQVS